MTQNKTLIEKMAFAAFEVVYGGAEHKRDFWEACKAQYCKKIEVALEVQAALQSEQAGVNEELLNILNAILQHNKENELFDRCCNDGDGRFDTFQSEELVTLLDTAKQAVANAESCKPSTLSLESQIEQKDEQIRILREGIKRIGNHSMASDQKFQRKAEVIAICTHTLAAADKLEQEQK